MRILPVIALSFVLPVAIGQETKPAILSANRP